MIYLFVDGLAERLHLGQPREAVLAAWGVLADGHKVLLHMAPGSKEDTASCREFFHDLRRRGLPDPLLVVSDGAPGLIRAIEECFPRSVRQRCLAGSLKKFGRTDSVIASDSRSAGAGHAGTQGAGSTGAAHHWLASTAHS